MRQFLSSSLGGTCARSLVGSVALFAVLCGSKPVSAQSLDNAVTDLDLKTFAKGLNRPTDIAILPDGRAVITLQGGDVVVMTQAGAKTAAGHIPINAGDSPNATGEQGLLGVIADPNYGTNHFVYFYADVGATATDKHQILRYVIGTDSMLGTKTVLLGTGGVTPGIYGPANHNGGSINIYNNQLYIGVGDTGANATPPTNKFSSCLNHPNGKILRLNLDGSVPADNPLSNVAMATACGDSQTSAFTMAAPDKRIWAWGFRNPFRFWIDPSGPQAGTLWVGDVGEVTREEVSVGKGDSHFGYPFFEGTKDWGPGATNGPANECMGMVPARACTPAVYDYGHDNGNNCIIGGLVIDGCGWPDAWKKRYIFGDHGSGNVWTLEVNAARTGVTAPTATVFGKMGGPASFRMGSDSALYIVEVDGGSVERITPKNQAAANCPTTGGSPDAGGGAGGANGAGGASGVGGANGAGGAATGAGGASNPTGTGAGGAANGTGGDSSGTSMTTGGLGAGGDNTAAPAAAEDTGGCGCRSAASGPMGLGAGFAAFGTIAVGLLRRRRSRRK
jgi:glucose/arabinose dehydrogenase